jgi:hypothetical protein
MNSLRAFKPVLSLCNFSLLLSCLGELWTVLFEIVGYKSVYNVSRSSDWMPNPEQQLAALYSFGILSLLP